MDNSYIQFNTTSQRILLVLIGGLLAFLAWPPLPLTAFAFCMFIPLLLVQNSLYQQAKLKHVKRGKFVWLYAMLFFLIWNATTTWWVKNATLGGGIFAVIANSLLMSIPFMLFHKTRMAFGNKLAYLSFICYWLSFEYIHLHWEITWPWLTLGNVFAMHPAWVQWYEITGTSGGSLWVLVINLLLFLALQQLIYNKLANGLRISKRKWSTNLYIGVGIIILPILLSIVRYTTYTEQGIPQEVVVVQPNVDPFNEKFDRNSRAQQMDKLVQLSLKELSSNTDFLVFPETSLPTSIWLSRLYENNRILQLKAMVDTLPQLSIITGVTLRKRYKERNATPTVRNFRNTPGSYDRYNSALLIDTTYTLPYYFKSKLVPGVERMPYPAVLRILEPLAIDLGGIVGSQGTQENREALTNAQGVGIGPVICYESVFSEYVTEYITAGAQLIFIITNDGWWGNTPGHIQHLHYARLRALETRRAIARSANTGISAFINQRGDIEQASKYWVPAVLKQEIYANKKITFYVRFGDYLSRIALLLAIGLLLYTFSAKILNSKPHKT